MGGNLLFAQQAAVLSAEQTRFTAQIKQDAATLQAILHDDLYYLHSNGLAESKDDFITSVTSGKIVYQNMQSSQHSFRQYGKTAILTGLLQVDGLYEGTPFSVALYYTSVYLRKKGRWWLLSWQSTGKRG